MLHANGLFAAQSFANHVRNPAADQGGCRGPVMQAEDYACDGRGDTGDLDDHANLLEIWVCIHAGPFSGAIRESFLRG
jgi:hypothetical protein